MLLSEPGNAAHDYSEALIFHTINSTAKPLDGEQALQLILGQRQDHTMPPHLEFNYAPALYLTRLLDEKIRALPEQARTRLGGRSLLRLSQAAKELLHSYPARAVDLATIGVFADEITGALLDLCTHLHADFPDFCAADYFIELATHVWMRTKSETPNPERLVQSRDYLRDMARWMGTDGLRGLTIKKPLGSQLTEIYDAVRNRIPKKVFLARWYPKPADGVELTKADLRLEQIRRALDDLRRAEGMNLELIDMGTTTAGTDMIQPKMYEAILSSDIIVIDLSGVRPNVCVEAGYALKHHEKGRLLFIFEPTAGIPEPPFDVSTFQYIKIAQAAEIPGGLKPHISTIMRDARLGRI